MGTSPAVDVVLPALPSSAGTARRLLREALGPLARADSLDSAQLAVSEVVTNALVHAGTPVRLRILVTPHSIRVEVGDGSPRLPVNREHAPISATGRGLHLVSEVADSWGVYRDDGGKVVWFELTEPPNVSAGESPPETDEGEEVARHTVELLNMPLLIHAAWQEHAAALLRELLLVRLDDGVDALEQHAAASEALSLLFGQVPLPVLEDDPDAIMATATEPGVSQPRVVLKVPATSVPHFAQLNATLDLARDLADTGDLLSPPTQPEVRAMRQWLCAQVRVQSEGGPAQPWSSPIGAEVSTRGPLDWDPAVVTEASEALIAADDSSLIVAVSDGALDLLGYDRRDELVGQRLLAIIPGRYHQAHIAGFTLHLINGRRPLIGARLTVPVLQTNGDEFTAGLTLRREKLADGRPVFIAELHV